MAVLVDSVGVTDDVDVIVLGQSGDQSQRLPAQVVSTAEEVE